MVLFGGSIHFSHSTVVKQRYKAAAENWFHVLLQEEQDCQDFQFEN